MHTTVEFADENIDYNCLPDFGGYRVKQEKAEKIIELVKDAFLRKHTTSGHLEAPRPQIWSFSAALERMKMCCTSDPHAQERRRIEEEIQDLKRRRAVAAKLLDEVEQEVEVIQTCLQDRVKRGTDLEKLLPRNCWTTERASATLQGGGFELRRGLRSRLDNALAAAKTRDEELRQVYSALKNRDEELTKVRQQQFATSASPSVRAGMQKYFRGGKVRPLDRTFQKVERASLHIVLIVWQQYFRQCCFVERVCRLLTKVLESTREGVEGVDPLIYKLRSLRNQVPPAESWELLNALDWSAGSMTHSPTSVQQPIMAITDIGGHGPWYAGLKGRSCACGILSRNERYAIERQLLNRFFTTSMGRNQRASLRTSFAGWKLRAHQQHRAKRILTRTSKSWAQGSAAGSLKMVFASWHQEIQRGKRVLHEELIAGMRTRQNELERLLSGGHGDLPDTRRDARSDGSSRSPAKVKATSPPQHTLPHVAKAKSNVVSLGTSMSGPAGPRVNPGRSGPARDTDTGMFGPSGPLRDTGMFGPSGPLRDTDSVHRGPLRDTASAQRGAGVNRPLRVVLEGARGLRKADWMGKSDPYCVCSIPGKPESKVQTPYLESTLDPVWNHASVIENYTEGDSLEFSVWDRDPPPKKDDLLGRVILNSSQIAAGFSGELQLLETKGVQSFLIVTVAPMDTVSAPASRGQRAPGHGQFMASSSGGSGPGQFMMPSSGAGFASSSMGMAPSREPMGGTRDIAGLDTGWGAQEYQDDVFFAPPPVDEPPFSARQADHSNYNSGNARRGETQQSPKSRPAAKGVLRSGQQQRAASGGNQGATKAASKGKSAQIAPGTGQGYTVFLDRATDDSLGIEVRHDTDRDAIIITKVGGGLAGRWNDENPGNQIHPGDQITEVNGIQAPVQALLERCRVDEVLMMTLTR